MSGAFKNAKRKLSQSELRKYMNEHKSKLKEKPKIDSPLAKYPFCDFYNDFKHILGPQVYSLIVLYI